MMESALTLSPLFGEGCVLQSGMPVKIWGTGCPGTTVEVAVAECHAVAAVGEDGSWAATLGPLAPGGPYRMTVRPAVLSESEDSNLSESGDSCDVNAIIAPISHESGDSDSMGTTGLAVNGAVEHDIYVGEVFICAGQSNMEYQMEFLRWRYPSEYTREPDPLLRHCKVPVRFDFHGPRRDFDEPVRWVGAAPDTLDEFTGVGYFFGRMIRQWLGVPVGLLNITLGGSPIESWMDEQTLAAWPKALADLEPYRDDEVARTRSEQSIAAMNRWYEDLRIREAEAGQEDLGHGTLELPAFLKDTDPRLAGFRGVIHLRRTVTLPAYAAGHAAALHLGAMVDSDETSVNGVKIGQSEHQYLSRDYMVPEGVLKAGRNEIDVRLVVEHGTGRVTPGKHMHLDMGDDSYDLDGIWTYAIGARVDTDCPGEDFVRWKPLGLYNGMTATCAGYAARAALWYQGESNTGDVADDYGRMLAAMIGCWREAWGQRRLPFLIVQLPVFSIDGVEDGGWALVRKHQWQTAKSIEDVAAVVTLDAGDWNDLHPWNKSMVADRLFAAAQRLVYGKDDAPRSPEPTSVRLADGRLVITFDDGTGDCGLDTLDGADPCEFELVWEDGSKHPVPAGIEGNAVIIDVPWRRPMAVRYAWRNAPSRGLLCGSNGLPVPPFTESIA